METCDYLIVGGGIFGVYAAVYLSRKGYKIILIEKEPELLKKASIVNQARLHAGYHYPRSIVTARIANEYKERFTREHEKFINSKFDQYYAIEKQGTFTNSEQFKRFCDFLNIKAEKVSRPEIFNQNRIEDLYLTREYSFDPVLIAEYYKELIKLQAGVALKLNCNIRQVTQNKESWVVELIKNDSGERESVKAYAAINATYTGTNTVNRLFNLKEINLVHQITEIALVSSPPLEKIGLTVMDGTFCSFMPYGFSGLLSLSSVAYSHHKVSYENKPAFDCQEVNKECRPAGCSICSSCFARPESNYYKMICQIKKYLAGGIGFDYIFSLFTVKTKLQSSYIDDGRPTEISRLNEKPAYYCLFAGKINSIYQIENEVQNV